MPTAAKTKKDRTAKEDTADYDVPGQYIPVYDKDAALQAIFSKGEADYGLALFSKNEKKALDLWQKGDRYYLHCLKREKKVIAKPEEVIRQLTLMRVITLGYALDQLSLEVAVKMGSTTHSKAADIVIYREERLKITPYIIIELKRPKRKDGLDQLETYMNPLGAPFGCGSMAMSRLSATVKTPISSKRSIDCQALANPSTTSVRHARRAIWSH